MRHCVLYVFRASNDFLNEVIVQQFVYFCYVFVFTDSLTLQLWKDRRDWEKNPPTKGSIGNFSFEFSYLFVRQYSKLFVFSALEEYLGWEAGFTLDRESQTLAIILKNDIISLAFDNRENLIRWQVRLTGQFEEGQHFNAHLVQTKSKSFSPGN